jgi:transposase
MRALTIPWSAEELERRYRAAQDVGAARRYQALWLRARGLPAGAAAAAVGVSAETLRAWVRRGRAEGLDALAARKPGSGARPKLDPGQQERVLAWADAEPALTLHQLAARVGEELGVGLSHTQVWVLLRRAGFRRVVPRKRHHEADPAAQAAAQKN